MELLPKPNPAPVIDMLMKQHKIGQQYLATYLDIGIATISRRLHEQNDFWLSEVNTMASIFKQSPLDLFLSFYTPLNEIEIPKTVSEPDNHYQKKVEVEQVNINKDIHGSYFSQVANSVEENKHLHAENAMLKEKIEQLQTQLLDKVEVIELLKDKIKMLQAK